MTIDGKIAVVVGATGGMGTQASKALHKEGCKLILVAKNEEKLKALSQEVGNAPYFVCDLTQIDSISQVCSNIIEKYRHIDFLLNAAGIGVYKQIEDVAEEEWLDSFTINVTAAFLFTKYLLPALKQSEHAKVLNWGSGMGVIPTGGRSIYCTSKFALRGMSLSLSEEFRGSNIHIVLLTLGSVLTEFGPLTLAQKQEENLQGKAYLTTDTVTLKVIEVLKDDNPRREVELYPSGYEEGIR